jgi:6-phosphogluconolactonase (cycloisomerase 2 family)
MMIVFCMFVMKLRIEMGMSTVSSRLPRREEVVCVWLKTNSLSVSFEELSCVDIKGTSCCHVACDHQGNVWAANYSSGSTIGFAPDDRGALQEPPLAFLEFPHVDASMAVPDRQEHPHAHQVRVRTCLSSAVCTISLLCFR